MSSINNNNNNNSNMDDTTSNTTTSTTGNVNFNGNGNNSTTNSTTTSPIIKRKLIDNRRRRTSTFALDGTSSLSSVIVGEPEIELETDTDNDNNRDNVISTDETTKQYTSNNNNNSTCSGINTTGTAVGTTSASSGSNPTTGTSSSSTTSTNTTTTTGFVRDPIYIYSSLIAGIGSGVVSGIACAPLDLIKTRMQIWGSIAYQSTSSSQSPHVSHQQNSNQHIQRIIPLNSTTSKSNNVVGIRTIYYMLHDIIKTEGIIGCFRGLGATLVTVPAFWGVYFPLYDDLKRYWLYHYPDHNIAIVHMGSAVTAGAISDVICNPMFVVRTRLQTEAVHASLSLASVPSTSSSTNSNTSSRNVLSMRQTIQVLYKEGGIASFWRGMTANLLGLSHVAIQFPAYEYFKKQLLVQKQIQIESSRQQLLVPVENNNQQHQKHQKHQNQNQQHNTAFHLLLASAASKMIASVVTYPHEVIRSRMMDARSTITNNGTTQQQSTIPTPIKRLGFIETCSKIYKQEGMIGFYSGLPVSLIRVVPNTCVTFITYELFLRYSREHLFNR